MTSGRTISSGQDSVTKTGFNLMFETTKDWKKNYVYERMAFKTKDISQQKTENPGIWATNEVSPGTAQLLSWENV